MCSATVVREGYLRSGSDYSIDDGFLHRTLDTTRYWWLFCVWELVQDFCHSHLLRSVIENPLVVIRLIWLCNLLLHLFIICCNLKQIWLWNLLLLLLYFQLILIKCMKGSINMKRANLIWSYTRYNIQHVVKSP